MSGAFPFPPAGWTVEEAKDWLRPRIEEGEECPVCRQYVKLYRRQVTGPVARVLIAMYRGAGDGWVHIPSMPESEKGGDLSKARFWDLIEAPEEGVRPDGSRRTGFWRLTPVGVAFVLDSHRIRKYAMTYNNHVLRFEGELVSIRDALSTKFDYSVLMGLT